MLDEYRKEKRSLGKAAELAGVNLWEFIEHCRRNQIKLDLTEAEVEIGIRRVEKIGIQKYKKNF